MGLPDSKYANSAGRLLQTFRSIGEGIRLYDRLPELILDAKLPEKPSREDKCKYTYLAIVEIQRLYVDFVNDMNNADIPQPQKDVLLGGLSKLESRVYTHNLENAINILTEAEYALLEVCATTLMEETRLEDTDLDSIKASLEELNKQIESSDTPPQLRKILLEFVRLSNDSIARYQIHGAKAFRNSLKGMLAEVGELYASTDKNKQSEMKKAGAWNVIVKHLYVFDSVVGKLQKYPVLIEKTKQLFLGNNDT